MHAGNKKCEPCNFKLLKRFSLFYKLCVRIKKSRSIFCEFANQSYDQLWASFTFSPMSWKFHFRHEISNFTEDYCRGSRRFLRESSKFKVNIVRSEKLFLEFLEFKFLQVRDPIVHSDFLYSLYMQYISCTHALLYQQQRD